MTNKMNPKLSVIHTGNFKLDGGAMFGVVPKSIWKNINPPDDNNMCTWAMRCLIVDEGDRIILIDTGMGNKMSEKFKSHFYPHGEQSLSDSIANAGYKMEDITDVLLTHFHFDHVGGAVTYSEKKELIPTFPNAKYWTNELHYNWALNPNPREQASFLKENFVPLKEAGVLNFIDVEEDIAFSKSISLKFVYGHTEAMMLPIIKIDNQKLAFTADLLPSQGHIGMPYVMSYDVRPLVTLKEKATFFDFLEQENVACFLEHDKDAECLKIKRNEKGRMVLDHTFDLADITNLSF